MYANLQTEESVVSDSECSSILWMDNYRCLGSRGNTVLIPFIGFETG
jgi:hypothetical protein